MRKYLFLDFDGVLNTPKTWGLWTEDDDSKAIDPERVAIVNRIVAETGCRVVISSTWRLHRSLEELTKLLKKRGATFTVWAKTPDFNAARRNQILDWLASKAGPYQFVILDDDPAASIAGHFVQTNATEGLTEALADQVIAIFNKKGQNG